MIPPLFGKQEVGIWRGTYMKLVTKYQISPINSCWEKCDEKCAYMFNVYKNQLSRQTGSRNLMDPKTLPTIWGTYMKLVIKYQISAINSCWEKYDEKCAYMFNVYKNQLSRQTGSRNLTGPKTLPTIWYTYMTLVTKYQISAINSYWEKCDQKYLGRTEGRKDKGKTVYPPPPSGSGGIKKFLFYVCVKITCHVEQTVNFGNAIKLFPLIMLTKEIFNWLAAFHAKHGLGWTWL
jgi:hypothetical protein